LIELYEIQGLFPNILQEGFSAYKASLTTSSDIMITNWNVASPFFSSGSFVAATGVYTVPVTGVYAMQATISYATSSVITTQLGTSINPTFSIGRLSPTTATLIRGQIPVFYTNVLVLSLRTILASSTITLSDVIRLTEGDTLGLLYNADGMTLSLDLKDIQWTIYRLQ